MAKKNKADAPPAGGVKVRVLVDCLHGRCNDVTVIAADQVAAAVADGRVDQDEAAVAYAETLPQNQPED